MREFFRAASALDRVALGFLRHDATLLVAETQSKRQPEPVFAPSVADHQILALFVCCFKMKLSTVKCRIWNMTEHHGLGKEANWRIIKELRKMNFWVSQTLWIFSQFFSYLTDQVLKASQTVSSRKPFLRIYFQNKIEWSKMFELLLKLQFDL